MVGGMRAVMTLHVRPHRMDVLMCAVDGRHPYRPVRREVLCVAVLRRRLSITE